MCYSAYLLCLRTTSSQDGFEEVIIHKGLLIALNASHYCLIRQDQRVTCADKVAFLAFLVYYLFSSIVMTFSHLYIKLPHSAFRNPYGDGIKTDEFSEKFQMGGGEAILVHKFMLQNLDL